MKKLWIILQKNSSSVMFKTNHLEYLFLAEFSFMYQSQIMDEGVKFLQSTNYPAF